MKVEKPVDVHVGSEWHFFMKKMNESGNLTPQRTVERSFNPLHHVYVPGLLRPWQREGVTSIVIATVLRLCQFLRLAVVHAHDQQCQRK